MRTSSLDFARMQLYVNENRLYFTHKSLEGQLKHCKTLIYYIFYVKNFIYQRILIVYTFDILFLLTRWNVSANQDKVIFALN